ncbi:GHKL domain-containing protein [Pedobacter sp. HMF7056]|uniref:histidine kinase n=2 Tax=Hufsiella ginkgonis TaxID=2695274 RepID=A0A7K1XUK5_9SPHI|nr:GHKL domain-containing protein [Hufsiella ginkgonis]
MVRNMPARVNLSALTGKNITFRNGVSGERYARLLQYEQFKSDSLFKISDSIIRSRFPVVSSQMDVAPDNEDEEVKVNFRMDVFQVEDATGRVYQETRVVPPPVAITRESIRVGPRRDSLAKYIAMDHGQARVLFLTKPRISQVSLPILEEDQKNRPKEVSRVSNFVKQKRNRNAFQALVADFEHVNVPLAKRVKKNLLDSLLRSELKSRDINIAYNFKVASAKSDSMIFTKISNKEPYIPQNTYQTKLFPGDIVGDGGLLTIAFPDKNHVILSKMSAMMGSSGALLLVLLFCFGYTIHSILKQKKISEMKTDFINNMTHEFKTPVATIMIASEALRDPEITEDRNRISRLAGIIYDENVRLGNHIERVLNIAKIDKEDLKLEHKPVEMNDLVSAVIDSMGLQLNKKNARLTLNLDAQKSVINGDELHLSNVIFNLVDNAIKYSKDDPEITITTLNTGKNLLIRVADKGIGMNRDQLTRIFEQFYRIPTGNLHDVKGFGLGLSYVSNIVKKLDGSVKAKSEKDKGSEFEITLPLAATQDLR